MCGLVEVLFPCSVTDNQKQQNKKRINSKYGADGLLLSHNLRLNLCIYLLIFVSRVMENYAQCHWKCFLYKRKIKPMSSHRSKWELSLRIHWSDLSLAAAFALVAVVACSSCRASVTVPLFHPPWWSSFIFPLWAQHHLGFVVHRFRGSNTSRPDT